MQTLGKKPVKKFLGKTDNFKDANERRFYQRMKDNYLKGHDSFSYKGKIHKVEYEYNLNGVS